MHLLNLDPYVDCKILSGVSMLAKLGCITYWKCAMIRLMLNPLFGDVYIEKK